MIKLIGSSYKGHFLLAHALPWLWTLFKLTVTTDGLKNKPVGQFGVMQHQNAMEFFG
jgi:hypothetical protein